MQTINTVCVVGLGYIGLPTAAFFATHGKQVIGVDVNPTYVEKINAGEVPFYEPDFGEILQSVVANKSLVAQAEMPSAEAYIVAVPTPFRDDYSIDDKYIRAAASAIAPVLSGGELVILESTSPPGTTESMARMLTEFNPALSIATDDNPDQPNAVLVAHCPERVLPGRIVEEMTNNDRVVGGLSRSATETAAELYSCFCKGDILLTDAATAEMAKLAENAFRDVNIAYANELSKVCDHLGINVWELIGIANHHPRVNILQPGPGVGGHCIAVDPWFIVSAAPEMSPLLRTARGVNDSKPEFVLEKVTEAVAQAPADAPIAVLGIAFKADIDDLRESPSLEIACSIADTFSDRDVLIVEPNIEQLPERFADLSNTSLVSLDDGLERAGVVVLLVDHSPFRAVDPARVATRVIVDAKGLWTAKPVRKFGE